MALAKRKYCMQYAIVTSPTPHVIRTLPGRNAKSSALRQVDPLWALIIGQGRNSLGVTPIDNGHAAQSKPCTVLWILVIVHWLADPQKSYHGRKILYLYPEISNLYTRLHVPKIMDLLKDRKSNLNSYIRLQIQTTREVAKLTWHVGQLQDY